MKRIACALYGQPRFVNEGYSCIKKMLTLENFEVDYYCHSYQGLQEYDSSPWSDGNSSSVLLNTKQNLTKLYNPVEIKVNRPFDKDLTWIYDSLIGKQTRNYQKEHNEAVYNNISNIASQLYSRASVGKLVHESQIDYDFVVTTRYDFRVPFDTSFFDRVDNTKIYTNNSCGHINDNFLIMGQSDFLKIMNIYSHLPRIINNKKLAVKLKSHDIDFIFNIENLISISILYHHGDFGKLVRTSLLPENFR